LDVLRTRKVQCKRDTKRRESGQETAFSFQVFGAALIAEGENKEGQARRNRWDEAARESTAKSTPNLQYGR
jgi:hypothetical protein